MTYICAIRRPQSDRRGESRWPAECLAEAQREASADSSCRLLPACSSPVGLRDSGQSLDCPPARISMKGRLQQETQQPLVEDGGWTVSQIALSKADRVAPVH